MPGGGHNRRRKADVTMGELADDIIDGTTCELCGCFFVDAKGEVYTHGFPAVCWDCWRDLTKPDREQCQRALVRTL